MATIPSKQLHRAGTYNDLLTNLSDREIGIDSSTNTLYFKYDGRLYPCAGSPIPTPDSISLLMGFEEDADSYTYDWKTLESDTPIQDTPLRLWSRLAGMGFYAEVAHTDSKGRDIAEQLDYASVLIAVYNATEFSDIHTALSLGKTVILSVDGHTGFAYLHSANSSSATFRSLMSPDHTYVEYTVDSSNTWTSATVDMGEATPTPGSDKLLTSGGAYDALQSKVNKTGVTPGTYSSVTVNEEGAVTDGGDLPAGSVTAEMLEVRKKLKVDGNSIHAVEDSSSVVLCTGFCGWSSNGCVSSDVVYNPAASSNPYMQFPINDASNSVYVRGNKVTVNSTSNDSANLLAGMYLISGTVHVGFNDTGSPPSAETVQLKFGGTVIHTMVCNFNASTYADVPFSISRYMDSTTTIVFQAMSASVKVVATFKDLTIQWLHG